MTINDRIIKALRGAGFSVVKGEEYILLGDCSDPDYPTYYKLTISKEN